MTLAELTGRVEALEREAQRLTMAELTKRVEVLERDIAHIRKDLSASRIGEPWWRAIAGEFTDDPDFEEAVRLGREYRESLRERTDNDCC